jgi:CRP-like cAMP-binding protein
MPAPPDLRAALRQHLEKIVALTDAEFELAWSHFSVRRLKRHQYVVQAGEAVSQDFFVGRGLLRAYFTDEAGKEHIVQLAPEDWWITDYQAYFLRTPATLSVDCLEASELLCLSLDQREQLCARLPAVERFFRKKSNLGYVALQRRILSLLTSSAKQRYEQLLQQHPQLVQRVPKTILAAYLGVSRETLSRLAD